MLAMGAIVPFLKDNPVFEPHDIQVMSIALDDVCKTLHLLNGSPAREVIAERIIALARLGERSPALLRARVLREARMAFEPLPPLAKPAEVTFKARSGHY